MRYRHVINSQNECITSIYMSQIPMTLLVPAAPAKKMPGTVSPMQGPVVITKPVHGYKYRKPSNVHYSDYWPLWYPIFAWFHPLLSLSLVLDPPDFQVFPATSLPRPTTDGVHSGKISATMQIYLAPVLLLRILY